MTTQNTESVPAQELASTAEQVSQPAGAAPETKVVQPPVTPSPEEAMRKLIADEVAKAVEQAKDIGRRQLQSEQDRNKAELARAQRRAQVAETTLGSARTQLYSRDPEAAKEMELAELRVKEQTREQQEQEEQARQAQVEFNQQFHANLNQVIVGLGINPQDKRIDWGQDAPNYLEAQRRILDSVIVIQKEQAKATQTAFEQRLKDLESKVSKTNVEVNSVTTTPPGGAVNSSDVEFLKKWGSGELPETKENIARARKLEAKE